MRRRTRRTRRSTRISSSPLAWPAIRTSRTRTGSRWYDGSRCKLSEPSESHNRNGRTLTRSTEEDLEERIFARLDPGGELGTMLSGFCALTGDALVQPAIEKGRK